MAERLVTGRCAENETEKYHWMNLRARSHGCSQNYFLKLNQRRAGSNREDETLQSPTDGVGFEPAAKGHRRSSPPATEAPSEEVLALCTCPRATDRFCLIHRSNGNWLSRLLAAAAVSDGAGNCGLVDRQEVRWSSLSYGFRQAYPSMHAKLEGQKPPNTTAMSDR
ncbi:hypothetical protein RRG08_060287 [Elysia crispata]|uniref:Uncharacterized protein n=1 Tax=Elysia crispata TaxID=231223 RepID=A0AAE1AC74_9GAST|nr:hypothetical protein RRG08_060287 [Elysia crispata]